MFPKGFKKTPEKEKNLLVSKMLSSLISLCCTDSGRGSRCCYWLQPEVYLVQLFNLCSAYFKLLTLTPILTGKIALGGVSTTEISDRKPKSAGQDQTARMCRLILPCTYR